MTPQDRAKRAARAMWSDDTASAWIGMRIVRVDEGQAEHALTIEQHHCNGHGIGHGGITFALTDSAFAFACNSRNQSTVAQHNMISFLAPVQKGDQLTATAREVSLSGRSGIYDVRVINQNGQTARKCAGFPARSKDNFLTKPMGRRPDHERPDTELIGP